MINFFTVTTFALLLLASVMMGFMLGHQVAIESELIKASKISERVAR